MIIMIFGGCEPTISTQQITQSAQNLRENVRNIDTQRITQGAQNLRENIQNFRTSSSTQNQSIGSPQESLNNTDPVLSEILGDILDEEPVINAEVKQEVAELDTTRLSDENDFEASKSFSSDNLVVSNSATSCFTSALITGSSSRISPKISDNTGSVLFKLSCGEPIL